MLLFYLAYRGEWMSREELAFFFRPDADEATARHYVRKMLSGSRQMGWVQGLEVEPKRLRWNVDTDVFRFRNLVSEGCWAQALKLYRGKLLSGLDLNGAPSFESWLELEREELWLLWQEASLRYAAELEGAKQHHQAAAISKKLLQDNTIAEEALQSYMRNAYLGGQREQALQAYQAFEKELRDELEVEPLEATIRLAEAIRLAKPLEGVKAGAGHLPSQPLKPAATLDGQQALGDLLELLLEPDARLITLIDSGNMRERASIARRAADMLVALDALAQLTERMVSGGHRRQALELLALTRKYTALHLGHHKNTLEETLQSLKHTQTLLAARVDTGIDTLETMRESTLHAPVGGDTVGDTIGDTASVDAAMDKAAMSVSPAAKLAN
jgi:DNA-binding SARP family transcriptional activator